MSKQLSSLATMDNHSFLNEMRSKAAHTSLELTLLLLEFEQESPYWLTQWSQCQVEKASLQCVQCLPVPLGKLKVEYEER